MKGDPSKIMHCITSLHGDGAQRMLLRLTTALNELGLNNIIVSLSGKSELAENFKKAGSTVLELCMPAGRPTFAGFLQLTRLIKRHRPGIIQGWMHHANLAATVASWASGVRPYVYWNIRRSLYDLSYDGLSTKAAITLGALLSHHTRAIIYNSDVSRRQHETIGYCAKRSIMIYNGFDYSRYRPDPSARIALLQRLNIPGDAIIVGCVGRFHPHKGQSYLLEAIPHVVAKVPHAHFVLAGREVDARNNEIARLLKNREVSNVHLLGGSENVEKLMAAFDVYCSPSTSEGFPNVLAEAMSCGVPCVATDAGASAQLLEGLGLIVERGNSSAISQAILSMIQLGPLKRAKLGELGRRRITEQYSMELVIERYRRLYLPETALAPAAIAGPYVGV